MNPKDCDVLGMVLEKILIPKGLKIV